MLQWLMFTALSTPATGTLPHPVATCETVMEAPDINSTAEESDSQNPAADSDEAAIDAASDDAQARLWLRTLVPLLQIRATEADQNPGVQKALDRMYRAAADRATRILRADMLD